jgi:DNA polymerase-3 subunit delta'
VSAALWDEVVGQDAAVALLRRAVAADRLAHAYAFVGPPGVGRRLVALGLAQACLCRAGGCGTCPACRRVAAGQHPDCHLVAPVPPADNPRGAPAIRIEQVRALEHQAALAPHEGARKVFVVDDAERTTLPAAQAFLKTLEEPPPRTLLVLVVANPRALPPTVLSRCQRVRFRPLGPEALAALLAARGRAPAEGALLARLCRGQLGAALAADADELRARREAALALAGLPPAARLARLDETRPDRATAAAYLEVYWFWFRDALCLAAGAPPALLVHADREPDLAALGRASGAPALAARLARVREAWQALEGNVTPRLVLDHALGEPAPGPARAA